MKKIITLALLGATTSLMAMYAEHAYMYKDPRIMGMGGANIAVGGYSTSIFSNPAGLATINKADGFVVDLLGLGVSGSSSIKEFADDLDKANTDAEMIALLSKYSGQNFHIGVDNYLSISKNSDSLAISIGVLAVADINLMAHGNGSDSGSLLETTSRGYAGVMLGGAKPFTTEYGRLDIGVGLKVVSLKAYAGGLNVASLLDDNVSMTDKVSKYETATNGIGLDIGATLHPFEGSVWHPAVGVSILNIGSIGMDNAYGGQPLTINVGASISPEVPFIERLVLAVDYVDLLNANKLRMYDYNSAGDAVAYTDYTDADFMKRLRVGLGLGLFNTSVASLELNTGLYQGSWTAGVDFEFLLLKLNVASYEEQLGVGSVDIPDRRYMVKLGVGW